MSSRALSSCLICVAVLLSACGGEDGPSEPTVPTATTINLLPQQAVLNSFGDTVRFSAVVRDQNGQGISAQVTYTSSDPGIVRMGSVGDATAVSNGVAQITAAAGAARATATITVAQEVASISLSGGDGQSGLVATPLSQPIRFNVQDALGAPVGGADVTFDVPAGAGAITPSPAVADEFGNLQVTWTLGSVPGLQEVVATTDGESTTFWANALGLPDLSVSAFDLSPMSPTDGQTVHFLVTLANGGTDVNLTDVLVQLKVDGQEVASFQSGPVPGGGTASILLRDLGPFAAGTRAVEIVIDELDTLLEVDESNNVGVAAFEVVTATALEVGVPASALTGAMGSQSFFTLEVQPSQGQIATTLAVALTGGSGNADLFVRAESQPTLADFDCSSTGGTSDESCVIDNPTPGTYHVLVQGAAAFADVSLEGTVTEDVGPQGTFNIELVYLNGATAPQRAAFEAARARWEALITADLTAVDFGSGQSFPANACTGGQREVVDVIDDLRIFVNLSPIDGPAGVLGSAGPCTVRNSSSLPVLGVMNFDTADLESLESNGSLTSVILHEMGHVIGIGTLWTLKELLVNPSRPSSPNVDTHFTGPLAIAAFDEAGGDTYTASEKVPVENTATAGQADGHWRHSVFAPELMTPFLSTGEPLSAISVASLGDLGYSVDTDLADDYTLPGSGGVSAVNDRWIDLSNDLRSGPIFVVDASGRVLRVIR